VGRTPGGVLRSNTGSARSSGGRSGGKRSIQPHGTDRYRTEGEPLSSANDIRPGQRSAPRQVQVPALGPFEDPFLGSYASRFEPDIGSASRRLFVCRMQQRQECVVVGSLYIVSLPDLARMDLVQPSERSGGLLLKHRPKRRK